MVIVCDLPRLWVGMVGVRPTWTLGRDGNTVMYDLPGYSTSFLTYCTGQLFTGVNLQEILN